VGLQAREFYTSGAAKGQGIALQLAAKLLGSLTVCKGSRGRTAPGCRAPWEPNSVQRVKGAYCTLGAKLLERLCDPCAAPGTRASARDGTSKGAPASLRSEAAAGTS